MSNVGVKFDKETGLDGRFTGKNNATKSRGLQGTLKVNIL
jgi:hypothetical protein